MPRPHRILPAGYVYHVLNRATDGNKIFPEYRDYLAFYDLLLQAGQRTPMRVIAFCLMPNHWHLVLWPTVDGAISAYVHWLCTSHSLQYHQGIGAKKPGHVYQGRFRCFPVSDERYYYNLMRYVEANALRAGMVGRAEWWHWSSAAERLRGPLLTQAGPFELPANWLDLINDALPEEDLKQIRVCGRASRPYGEADWVRVTADELGICQRLRPRGRPARPRP
jgi:putative transposase